MHDNAALVGQVLHSLIRDMSTVLTEIIIYRFSISRSFA
jgi:hypothetical protein